MVLDNYVTLPEGVPVRLHFTDHAVGDRQVMDPLLGFEKRISVLTLVVDEQDGRAVAKTLSVTSQNLAAQLSAYLTERVYRGYDYTITRRGAGFNTKFTVMAAPRSE